VRELGLGLAARAVRDAHRGLARVPQSGARHDPRFGPAPRARSTARAVPAQAEKASLEWKSKVLRDRNFDVDNFVPDMQTDKDGCRLVNSVRLVRMPYLPAFGTNELADIAGGNPQACCSQP